MTRQKINHLTYRIIGAAIEVHKAIGPGLLESVYHKCLKQELQLMGLSFESEFVVPIHYKGLDMETELRCDLLVEDQIVVELKAVDLMLPVFEAQLLTYMNLLKMPKGILINFKCANLFSQGQRTYVNRYFRDLRD